MTSLQFLTYCLATYRLTILITEDKGPGFIFAKLRQAPKKGTSLKQGLSCPFCVSIWMGLLVALSLYGQAWFPDGVSTVINSGLLVLAFSAAAILLNQVSVFLGGK